MKKKRIISTNLKLRNLRKNYANMVNKYFGANPNFPEVYKERTNSPKLNLFK